MKKQMGLWIDHRRALIVTVSDHGTVLKEILSHAEKQPRRTGDSPLKGSYEAQHVPPDGSRRRAFKKELNTYYDQVIETLREAETILLFGPGVAKTELKALLDKARFGERILALEAADKMSDTEITKKVMQQFA